MKKAGYGIHPETVLGSKTTGEKVRTTRRRSKRQIVKRNGVTYMKEGVWIRKVGDNWAVRTIHGQIFPGFGTKKEARIWGNNNVERGFKIISSPWYVDDM